MTPKSIARHNEIAIMLRDHKPVYMLEADGLKSKTLFCGGVVTTIKIGEQIRSYASCICEVCGQSGFVRLDFLKSGKSGCRRCFLKNKRKRRVYEKQNT